MTELKVLFDGTDVTADVGADLLSFAYTDRESDEADELRLTLMDPTGKWASSWRPDGGEKVRASIITDEGWLPCGEFTVDSLEYSGSPRVLEIGTVSVPLDTPIRRKAKTRAWEKMELRAIVEKLTTEAGIKLMWEADETPQEYERIDQNRESDLKFLMRLCRDNGLSLKVTDGTIVIFDRQSYERKPPVGSIVLGESAVLSWSFSSQKGQTYRSCRVSCRNPAKKTKTSAASYYNADFEKVSVKPVKKSGNPAVMEFTAVDTSVDGQEFELRKMASSRAEAERLARAKLRELNARAVTGRISVVGDVNLAAGEVICVSGFGAWNGNFLIDEASHTVGSGGYVTAISIRRCCASAS